MITLLHEIAARAIFIWSVAMLPLTFALIYRMIDEHVLKSRKLVPFAPVWMLLAGAGVIVTLTVGLGHYGLAGYLASFLAALSMWLWQRHRKKQEAA